jgi:hypothetical protein
MKLETSRGYKKWLAKSKYRHTKKKRLLKKHIQKYCNASISNILEWTYRDIDIRTWTTNDYFFALIPKEEFSGKYLSVPINYPIE